MKIRVNSYSIYTWNDKKKKKSGHCQHSEGKEFLF